MSEFTIRQKAIIIVVLVVIGLCAVTVWGDDIGNGVLVEDEKQVEITFSNYPEGRIWYDSALNKWCCDGDLVRIEQIILDCQYSVDGFSLVLTTEILRQLKEDKMFARNL